MTEATRPSLDIQPGRLFRLGEDPTETGVERPAPELKITPRLYRPGGVDPDVPRPTVLDLHLPAGTRPATTPQPHPTVPQPKPTPFGNDLKDNTPFVPEVLVPPPAPETTDSSLLVPRTDVRAALSMQEAAFDGK
jgi:hypothetical protein